MVDGLVNRGGLGRLGDRRIGGDLGAAVLKVEQPCHRETLSTAEPPTL
jgi:hypothetical protein